MYIFSPIHYNIHIHIILIIINYYLHTMTKNNLSRFIQFSRTISSCEADEGDLRWHAQPQRGCRADARRYVEPILLLRVVVSLPAGGASSVMKQFYCLSVHDIRMDTHTHTHMRNAADPLSLSLSLSLGEGGLLYIRGLHI